MLRRPSLRWTLWALNPGDYGPGDSPGVSVCHACPHVSMYMSRCFCTCECMNVFVPMWLCCLYLPIFCLCVHTAMCVGICFWLWLCVYICFSLKVSIYECMNELMCMHVFLSVRVVLCVSLSVCPKLHICTYAPIFLSACLCVSVHVPERCLQQGSQPSSHISRNSWRNGMLYTPSVVSFLGFTQKEATGRGRAEVQARLQGVLRASTAQLLPQQAKALQNQNKRLLNGFFYF